MDNKGTDASDDFGHGGLLFDVGNFDKRILAKYFHLVMVFFGVFILLIMVELSKMEGWRL